MKPFKQETRENITIIKFTCTTTTSVNAANFKDYLFRLHEYKDGKIIIDLREVLYLDSAFIGALVIYFKEFKNRKYKAKVIIGKDYGDIWSMFVTTNTFKEMNCYYDIENATNDFNIDLEKVA